MPFGCSIIPRALPLRMTNNPSFQNKLPKQTFKEFKSPPSQWIWHYETKLKSAGLKWSRAIRVHFFCCSNSLQEARKLKKSQLANSGTMQNSRFSSPKLENWARLVKRRGNFRLHRHSSLFQMNCWRDDDHVCTSIELKKGKLKKIRN